MSPPFSEQAARQAGGWGPVWMTGGAPRHHGHRPEAALPGSSIGSLDRPRCRFAGGGGGCFKIEFPSPSPPICLKGYFSTEQTFVNWPRALKPSLKCSWRATNVNFEREQRDQGRTV